MGDLEKAEEIAEKLRQELYRLLTNDCIIKAFRLKRRCRELGIPVRVVICIGRSRAKLFGRWLTIPVIHSWGEVAGKRIEVSRPLGAAGMWGIVPVNIKPVVALRI